MLIKQFAKRIRKAEWQIILRGLIVGWKFWAIQKLLMAKMNWRKIWQPPVEVGINEFKEKQYMELPKKLETVSGFFKSLTW